MAEIITRIDIVDTRNDRPEAGFEMKHGLPPETIERAIPLLAGMVEKAFMHHDNHVELAPGDQHYLSARLSTQNGAVLELPLRSPVTSVVRTD